MLKQEKKVYKETMDLLSLGVYWKDKKSRYLDCNFYFCQLLGVHSSDTIIGKDDKILNKEITYKSISKKKDNQTKILERSITHQNGVKKYLLIHEINLGKGDDKEAKIMGLVTEITSLKTKISTLKKQKNKTQIYLENIIARMPGSVYWKDKEGIYLGCNDYVAKMAGVASTKEVVGKTDYEFSWKEEAPAILQTECEIMESQVPRELEISGKLSNGEKATFLVVKTPLYNDHKKVSGILATSLDITERKKLEKNLVIAKDKAEAANIAKTEFIMNMSHDLRTPLAGIIGLSSLQADDATSAQEQQYGEWIHSAGEQLLELLNSVIEVTAAEHQIESVKKENINLQQFAEELRALMQPAIVSKGLEFQIKMDSNLPIVITDRIKLKRIILNLLSNAVKFTKQGKISLEIKGLMIKNDEAKIEILIADTGIGIAKDKIDKIFGRFYRAHPSYKAEYAGYGIGLFLVKKATKLLGGKIKVSSEEGKGSCFSLEFIFPIFHIDKITHPRIEQPMQSLGLEKINGAVLVAEDNAIVLFAVKTILTKLGYEVTAVTEGKAVLNALQTQSFILALLDIGLPDLDGTEIVRRYRQWEQDNKKSHLPIFALTAHAEKTIKDKCKNVGFDDVLTKPFTEKDIQTIQKFLDK
ncbi:MAG: ATP-binding protein [Candidatus Rickettsiella isopodorum]|jgi:two-component system, OmpR family, aerobic respiration control sensor histidine kinase ArcB|nr:ATP-binding protein [Candidatus Rickettsiella isopodorum]